MYTGGYHSLHSFIADSVLVTAALGTDNPDETLPPPSLWSFPASSSESEDSLFSGEVNLRDPATVRSIELFGWNAVVDTVSNHGRGAVKIRARMSVDPYRHVP